MLEIIGWILFGALAGWIASMIMGTNEQQGAIGNIVIGITGALIGGFIMRSFGSEVSGFSIANLIVAVFGAMILIFIIRIITRNGHAQS